jgi:hypothetical protein
MATIVAEPGTAPQAMAFTKAPPKPFVSCPFMYLVVIAWLYITLLMAVAEATAANGTVLGAIVTFVLYGLLPLGLVLYILGTPARKRALRAREHAERTAEAQAAPSAGQPDAGGHAPAGAEAGVVPPVRKEP